MAEATLAEGEDLGRPHREDEADALATLVAEALGDRLELPLAVPLAFPGAGQLAQRRLVGFFARSGDTTYTNTVEPPDSGLPETEEGGNLGFPGGSDRSGWGLGRLSRSGTWGSTRPCSGSRRVAGPSTARARGD